MRLTKLSNKEKKNEGFTLVELIVVIVILAILAAILVPALLGYIDKAKQQQSVLNGKSVLTAAQAELSSIYAKGGSPADIETNKADVIATADVDSVSEDITIKVGATVTDDTDATATNHAAYTVYAVMYKETGKEAIYYVYNSTNNTSSWDATATEYGNVSGTEYTLK